MANESLSIILVTKDATPFIDSAVGQVQAAVEEFGARVIAIDGHSVDGTWEVLQAQRGWSVHRQREPGLAAARNEAIALADTSLVAFLDADDRWLPGKLGTQLACLEAAPHTGVVSCLLRRVGPDEADTLHHALTPSGCVIRRSVFDTVGPFDTRYRLACDHAWFIRARRLGVAVEIIPRCLLHKQIHSANISHDRARYRRELSEILRGDG